MSAPSDPSPVRSPDDAMPSVEAPSAGFIVQLFVVPGVIVSIIILVWLGVNWLVQDRSDPRELIDQLRGSADRRYQAAYRLADMLVGDRHEEIKRDGEFAAALAAALDDEIEAGDMEAESILTRSYLCAALGHFRIADPLPTLVKAAQTERSPKEVEVRLAALQAIAVLTESVKQPLVADLAPAVQASCEELIDDGSASSYQSDLVEAKKLAGELARAGQGVVQLSAKARQLAATLRKIDSQVRTTTGAETSPDDDRFARLAAALAAQADQLDRFQLGKSAPLAKTLFDASRETHERTRYDEALKKELPYANLVRCGAAYSLGMIGSAEASERLEQMLDDGAAEVRYNAAAGLCRNGIVGPALIDVIEEMLLEPGVRIDEPADGLGEAVRGERIAAAKRTFQLIALRTIDFVARNHPSADLGRLPATVEQLAEQADGEVAMTAKNLAIELKQRPAGQ